MKSYDEMARDVLSRVSEYEAEQKIKRTRRTRIAAAATPVCAAAVIGAGIWFSGALMHADKPDAPAESDIITEKVTVSESGKVLSDSSVSAAVTVKNTERSEQASKDETASEAATAHAVGESTAAVASVKTEAAESLTTKAAETTAAPSTTQAASAEQTAPDNVGGDRMLWCIFISTIEWNGITYNANAELDVSAYTQDKYIGKVGDFSGTYKDSVNYLINPDDSVYTTKENQYVLLVVKAEPYPFYGSVIAMTNPEYINGAVPEKNDDTDEQIPYDDVVEYNGAFCEVYF